MSYTTISNIHQAIKTALRDAFPQVSVDDYDPEPELAILAPALLLELTALPLGEDLGDGRYPAACHFAIHCILGREVEHLELELWAFSTAVAMLVRQQGTWLKGGVLTAPEALLVQPGNVRRVTGRGYGSRVVSWQQTLYLGPSLWTADGLPPQSIYLGYAPEHQVSAADEHERIE